MASAADSDREYISIFNSTTIIFAASLVGLAFSLVRSKLLAVTFGPVGIGAFGFLTAVTGLLANVALLGTAANLTRTMAAAGHAGAGEVTIRQSELDHVMLALFGLVVVLCAAAVSLAWPSVQATFPPGAAGQTGLLAVAVVAAVSTIVANAMLRGLRLVRAQAIAAAGAAALSTIIFGIGVAVGRSVPIGFFAAIPFFSTAIFNWLLLRRQVRLRGFREFSPFGVRRQAALLLVCLPLLFSSIAGDVYGVAVRLLIYRETNAATLGLLQACLTLSDLYVSFLLTAMAADFLPKISGLTADRAQLGTAIDRQIQTCVILSAFLIVPGIVAARLVLWVAYGAAFTPATGILQLLLLASLIRTISWPLVLTVMAHGDNKLFLAIEVSTYALLLGLSLALQRAFGVIGIALAFDLVYLGYLGVLIVIVTRRYRVAIDRRTSSIVGVLGLASTALVALMLIGTATAIGIAICGVLATMVYCYRELQRMGIVRHLLARFRPKAAPGPDA